MSESYVREAMVGTLRTFLKNYAPPVGPTNDAQTARSVNKSQLDINIRGCIQFRIPSSAKNSIHRFCTFTAPTPRARNLSQSVIKHMLPQSTRSLLRTPLPRFIPFCLAP